eukprot:GCRY01002858.1.p1 GENE.GCRY01002858.1~~GCRY01002858.1.p1  ORF type:complete len:566 (+),score=165.80 GCRY01002858.1:187-1884(+)
MNKLIEEQVNAHACQQNMDGPPPAETPSNPPTKDTLKLEKEAKKPTDDDGIDKRSYMFPERTAALPEVASGFMKMEIKELLVYVLFWIVVFFSAVVAYKWTKSDEWVTLYRAFENNIVEVSVVSVFLIMSVITLQSRRVTKKPVYLIEFATFTAPDHLKISKEEFKEKMKVLKYQDENNLKFQERILDRTGLGDETYWAEPMFSVPPLTTMHSSRQEAEMVIFGTVKQLLDATGVAPQQIDILVLNCSLFCPTPSLTSMIVNKFKMRSDIITYNLGGMGCSAGVISIGLAKDLLQVHPNSRALVVSTESISENWYKGNERSMILPNTLFRLGGAAILLSNIAAEKKHAKYRLDHVVRIHKGADDESYNCVFQREDDAGKKGVSLSKKLVACMCRGMKSNLTVLGPLVLPWSEQLKFFFNLLQRRVLKQKIPPYVPDFRKAFDHFCIHAGGRAVIDGIEENLNLLPHQTEPSRATLYRYGNTSSSSIWYELGYSEQMGVVKKGHKIWQIAFGSGVKVNSAVWTCLHDIEGYPNAESFSELAAFGRRQKSMSLEDIFGVLKGHEHQN